MTELRDFSKPSDFRKNVLKPGFGTFFFLALLTLAAGCAIFAKRPTQLVSDAQSAIKAAHEVQAEAYAPELYREANEWMAKAMREYRLKNFEKAKEFAENAQYLAEQAEYEAMLAGANRQGPPPNASMQDGPNFPITPVEKSPPSFDFGGGSSSSAGAQPRTGTGTTN